MKPGIKYYIAIVAITVVASYFFVESRHYRRLYFEQRNPTKPEIWTSSFWITFTNGCHHHLMIGATAASNVVYADGLPTVWRANNPEPTGIPSSAYRIEDFTQTPLVETNLAGSIESNSFWFSDFFAPEPMIDTGLTLAPGEKMTIRKEDGKWKAVKP